MRIEEMETHTTMYDALTLAEKAGRSLQKDIESYEDIMEKLEEQKANHESVQEFIKDKGGRLEDDSELMEELERLEAGSVEDELDGKVNISQIKAQKLEEDERERERQERELELLEKQLEEIRLGDFGDKVDNYQRGRVALKS